MRRRTHIRVEYEGMETKLKRYLKDHGIKQSWLVERTGINQSWMHKVVNGKSLPKVSHALKIARALGVTVEELWGDEAE